MKLVYLLLLFVGLRSSAQSYADAKWIAKINLLSWLDPTTPALQPGIEYQLNKRSSIEFTIGIPTKTWQELKNTDSTYNKYFKLKAEIKYFPGDKRSFYIGPELSYISRKKSKFNDSFEGDDGKDYSYDYARLDKSVVAMAFKIGFVLPSASNSRWLFDTWFGAGPRFVFTNVDAVNTQPGGRGFMFWKSDREGSTTAVHVTLGLKLGYILH